MSDGCTDCGRKGGCDHRKQRMFAAMDAALTQLYPTRRWGERVEAGAGVGDPPSPALLAVLTDRLAQRLGTLVVHVPGGADETCDYVHVLCLGRTPSLLQLREGLVAPADLETAAALDGPELVELHLRVAVSSLGPFAAVQQVALRANADPVDASQIWIEETVRPGVFDPVLLPRFRTLVAVLAELGLRHLDFGEIAEAPAGFDPGDYDHRYGGVPALANYLFYPQPSSSITTTVLCMNPGGLPCPQS